MWFKNISLYQFEEPFNLSAEILETKLEEDKIKPCLKTESFRYGWVSPFDNEESVLVHSANNCYLITLCKEERVLPSSVVKDQLNEKIKTIENTEARKVYGKEKTAIKDELVFDLLPQAFTKRRLTHAIIDKNNQWIIIDTASSARAEEVLSLLRQSLEGLKVVIPQTNSMPNRAMTKWLNNGQPPQGFTFGESCELMELRRGIGVVKYYHQDLSSPEILSHLERGKEVTKLALCWQEKLQFVVNSDLTINRLQRLDILLNEQEDTNDEAARIDSDFVMMAAELDELLHVLFNQFGGLATVKNNKEAQVAESG